MAHKLHIHSMVVHAVAALAPVAAVSFVFAATGVQIASLHPGTWRFLLEASLVLMLLISVPSTITGVIDRDKMYATWHGTHRIKLALSVVLIFLTAIELVLLRSGPLQVISLLGVAVVLLNNGVVLALCTYGLKISLGRFGFKSTSYVPDMFKDPQVDILAVNAEHLDEPPKMIDIYDGMDPP